MDGNANIPEHHLKLSHPFHNPKPNSDKTANDKILHLNSHSICMHLPHMSLQIISPRKKLSRPRYSRVFTFGNGTIEMSCGLVYIIGMPIQVCLSPKPPWTVRALLWSGVIS